MVGGPGLLLLHLLVGVGSAVTEPLPAPIVHSELRPGLVRADILTSVPPAYAKYRVVLQNMNTGQERNIRPLLNSFEILYNELHVDVSYCLRAQIYDLRRGNHSSFSAPTCFQIPRVLPENLRVEGINTVYTLKWDWDYQQNPNVTFSVNRSYSSLSSWRAVKGCENITTTECHLSDIETNFGHKFLVSVYNHRTDEHNANIVRFNPETDTVIGPPTYLNLNVQNGDLYITVGAPEGFKDEFLRISCSWIYHLESWKNVTPSDVTTMKDDTSHFMIKAVEASTTYCARAHTECKEDNRTGLHSKVYCITTAPRSYIKEWTIGSVLGAIIVTSVMLYICLCPLKRYLKHVFFPKSKLPSSIEKGLQDSPRDYIKSFFLTDEETTDKCYIMQNSPVDAEVTIEKDSSGAEGQDSGNYSNEDENTGNSVPASQ